MALLSDLLSDLNARLNDAANVQLLEAEKIRYINHGIRQMYPSVYNVVRDASLSVAADTYEYALPSTIGADARVFRVEVEAVSGGGRYRPVDVYSVTPGVTRYVTFDELPGRATAKIRVFAAVRVPTMTATTETFAGWTGTEELPVLYAMGCVAGRRVDDRLDHRRLSTVASANGVTTETIEGATQFWFSQFDVALERAAMPLPVA